MTRYETTSLIVQGVAALGTLLLGGIAIWGESIRHRLTPPRLTVGLRSTEGEATILQDGPPARYYHLVVRNSRRWIPARNVTVYLVGLKRRGPSGSWQSEMATGPVPFFWQFEVYETGPRDVGPERISDLGMITKNGQFRLETKFIPNNLNVTLQQNDKMRIEAIARGDNCESQVTTLEIAWDGK